mmetsp:Transcript_7583/g.16903  ORF Transcript_7583/g.16903 Transcript_7583/m.16903 type:complete len:255 (-) Transcript_7583:466-1230(-)
MQHMTLAKHHSLVVANLIRQCIYNFQGTADDSNIDPTDLSQSPSPPAAREGKKRPLVIQYRECVLRLQLACFFRCYDVAKTVMKKCDDLHEAVKMLTKSAQCAEQTFCAGIVSAAIAGDALVLGRDAEGETYSSRAKEAVRRYEELCQHGPHFRHRLAALQAEINFHIDKDFSKASVLYDESIRLAGEHNYVHEQALVCELAGIFHKKELIDYEKACSYFEDAKKYYTEWGSKRKAQEMDKCITDLAIPIYQWF